MEFKKWLENISLQELRTFSLIPKNGAFKMNPFKSQNPSRLYKPHFKEILNGDKIPSSIIGK
jgi:hypothetical protein